MKRLILFGMVFFLLYIGCNTNRIIRWMNFGCICSKAIPTYNFHRVTYDQLKLAVSGTLYTDTGRQIMFERIFYNKTEDILCAYSVSSHPNFCWALIRDDSVHVYAFKNDDLLIKEIGFLTYKQKKIVNRRIKCYKDWWRRTGNDMRNF